MIVYDEIGRNDRTGRRHSSNTRSDRIRFHERSHTRRRRLRAVRRRGNLPSVRRSIPQAPLDVISFDHGYFTQ